MLEGNIACIGLTQNGEPICVMSSTTTFVEFPTVRGIGRANVLEDPPAVPVL